MTTTSKEYDFYDDLKKSLSFRPATKIEIEGETIYKVWTRLNKGASYITEELYQHVMEEIERRNNDRRTRT